MDRELANKKDEYLRAYCRKEYLELYEARKRLKEAEENAKLQEDIYETQLLLDKILNNKGSEKYRVKKEVYVNIDISKKRLLEAEENLKAKKKEGRKSDGYRRVGLVLKPVMNVRNSWYLNSLDGFSEKTISLMYESIRDLFGEIVTSSLCVVVYAQGMYGVIVDGKTLGVIGKEDGSIYELVKCVNKDLKCKPEVIVLPNSGKMNFFQDYLACYRRYGEFMKIFQKKFGISINSWLKQ